MPIFQTSFIDPINLGGFVNASQMHVHACNNELLYLFYKVQAAYRCAVALRDLINPYLLRRLKEDVLPSLPGKTEHVLMCNLSSEQRGQYLAFLKTTEVSLFEI